MKLVDMMKSYDKEDMFDIYSRVVPDYVKYERITKKKMIEEIIDVYRDYQNIIAICTVRELKYLKLILDNKEEKLEDEKYSFERQQLANKCLIVRESAIDIPEEIADSVRQAVKKVKWKEAQENDRINEVLVGICKVYGEIQTDLLVKLGSAFLNIGAQELVEHVSSNKLFLYYVCFGARVQDKVPVFIYEDYLTVIDELREERRKQGIAYSGTVDIEDFIQIFYYDLNINRKKVNTFYKKLKKATPLYLTLINEIRFYCLLNVDREQLKEFLEQFLNVSKKELKEIFQLLDEAMDEMLSGALNGATPNDAKFIRLEQERNKYQRELQYIPQRNANLSKKEASSFFKIYFALLEFTNNKYHINLNVKKIYKQKGVSPANVIDIVDKFWDNKESIIDEFIELNNYHFNEGELKLVREMKKGIRDVFVIARYEVDYTLMISNDRIYMVKGLYDNIDKIIGYQQLPKFVKTSLLPFHDKIVYDGIFQSASDVNFGVGLERMTEECLSKGMKFYHL